MSYHDWRFWLIAGAIFIVLGIIGILWGRHEEKSYYSHIADRVDVREYMSHSPFRPEPGALKIGGWICITVGIVLLIVSAVVFFVLGLQP